MTLLARVNSGVSYLVAFLLLVATLAIAVQIIIRFILTGFGLTISAPWTEELCRYAIVWSVYLGAAVLCRVDRLIAVDYLLHRLPARPAMILQTLAVLCTLGFFGLSGWLGWKLFLTGLHETAPVMRVPMAWVYAAVPLGALLAICNSVAFLGATLSSRALGAEQ